MSLGGASGPCAHPWGLPEEKLRALDEGGRVTVVDLRFRQTRLRQTLNNPMVEFGSVQAMLAAVNAPGTASMSRRYSALDSPWLQAAEGCTVGVGGAFLFPIAIIGGPTPPLDGPSNFEALRVGEVRVVGPAGEDYLLSRLEEFGLPLGRPVWEARIGGGGSFPTPGDWTFRIAPGPDLPELAQAVTLPDFAALPEPSFLRRGEDQELTWVGESFGEDDWLRISYRPQLRDSTRENRWSLSCLVRASAGELTIPGGVTAQLPDEAEGPVVWSLGLDQGGWVGEFEAAGADRAVYGYSFSRSGVTSME